MKSSYSVALAALCGVIGGAALVSALHAQSADAPAYFVGNV